MDRLPQDTDQPKLRLLILDTEGLFRSALARALAVESDMTVVGECATVEEVATFLKSSSSSGSKVDLILLDLELAGQIGQEFLAGLPSSTKRPKVVALTGGVSEFQAYKLLRSGVSGLLLKKETLPVLCEAVRRVAAGESALDSPWLKALVDRNRKHIAEKRPLTARERDVLRRVIRGLASKEIAFELRSTEPAVKSVIQQLFEKTGVRTRAQLVRHALEHLRDEIEE